MGPDAGTPCGATLQNGDLRRVPRACANIACPSWLAIARAPQSNLGEAATETALPTFGLLPAYRLGGLLQVARSYDPLAVTGRATGQLGRCPNLSFLHEFLAQFLLIGSGFPIHRKYLVHWPEVRRGIPVAIYAPLHEQRSEEHTSELQSPYDLVC